MTDRWKYAVAASTLLLAACGGASTTRSAQPRSILRVAVQQDAKTLNPILASNTVDGFIQRFLFEPLLSADPHGEPVPTELSERILDADSWKELLATEN